MKIKKIKTIKNYKPFQDFQWDCLCKDKTGRECSFSPFTVFFGENRSGKSSVCEILKDLTGFQRFEGDKPVLSEVELETVELSKNTAPNGKTYIKRNISTKTYRFEQGKWDDTPKEQKHILFFDVDFIDKNIHSHGTISNIQGYHTQNAGNLIISLDAQANKQKMDLSEKKMALSQFESNNKDILHLTVSPEEIVLFNKYKSLNKNQKGALAKRTLSEISDQKKDKDRLTKLLNKSAQIAGIQTINQLSDRPQISSKKVYIELFERDIKKTAGDGADSLIKAHYEQHKSFLEKDENYKRITDTKNKNCPLCMQPLSGATAVIKYYRQVFDKTYENEKQKYLSDIQNLEQEITEYLTFITNLPEDVLEAFSSFEKVNQEFEIKDLYNIDEKISYNKKFEICSKASQAISILQRALQQLKTLEKPKYCTDSAYDELNAFFVKLDKLITEFNKFIDSKNQKINQFKQKYSVKRNTDLEHQKVNNKIAELEGIYAFVEGERVEQIKKHEKVKSEKEKLDQEVDLLEDNLEKYLSEKIPQSLIDLMIKIIGRFNLNFTLKHIKLSPKTKEYPFSFRIYDKSGKERAFKQGLSEGERQMVSLAFFFALNENIGDKKDVILILDDPITSLDAPNLKILSDLIHEKTKTFGQIVVLTHHPLFYKYLSKCENPNPITFGIARNREEFGGSFIYSDPGFDLLADVKQCYQEMTEQAKKGTLCLEAIALKYGQLLRLAIERFIKNELLLWNKEDNFTQVTDNLISGKGKLIKLNDTDLERIRNIYKYCSYSNLLHADKEIPSAISELDNHIAEFIKITEKVY
ncbi:MAG: hypothetical protein A2900_00525 [Candidatus Chisholmbacteria bacterium RIFCSPLOWO2_01_FULL_50_28]|uniref:Protein CR006 P-loop domain-containing protein n=1 Tax=Candidatus Chisholmbacteria bacterium RIFCSPHIGHO2_01_FULL_52_32 TaxID=1797591 RepID=A0A1G1VRJ7_9BACT|nr:MAG: hypothetical protein A2786_00870 [Candidatus Chisholmbacteria bacterium RIFCSPHIGHO2_01_FULL_52_32]OGY19585.1 MAG: hypothetical protein A2900_00525 [Candidatus Chisholmbacteria bacterium RIFCSPLOWO2_01_FULL_50_28]